MLESMAIFMVLLEWLYYSFEKETMTYLYYLKNILKEYIILAPLIIILFLISWWVHGCIKMPYSLIGFILGGTLIRAVIRYKNDGKDLFEGY